MSTVVLFIKKTSEFTGAEGGVGGGISQLISQPDWLIPSGRQAYDFRSYPSQTQDNPTIEYCMTELLMRHRRGRVPRHIGRRHDTHTHATRSADDTTDARYCNNCVTRTARCRLHRLPRHAPARSPDYSIVARSTLRRCFPTTIHNRYLLYNSEQFILYIFVAFSTI